MFKTATTRSSAGFFMFAGMMLVLLLVGVVQVLPAGGEVAEYSAMSLVLGVVRGLAAVLLAWFTLRFLDHVAANLPGPMAEPFEKINESPSALAIYFGLRFLGVCYLYASAL